MKNFTNNFKQFTSRLSARWLIMALMLLVGTSSAWAVDVYFKNTLGWSNVYAYVRTSGSMWNGDNGVTTNNATRYNMTNIGDNVWKCTTSSTFAQIVFVKDQQDNYGNLWQTEASYNPSYTTSKPMFTPSTTLTETRNQTKYYNSGTWSTYTPPCETTSITWNNFTENMCLGDQQTLTATASSGATVTFSSGSTNATISGTTLTAATAGSATITASVAASGSYCSATANKTVTISNCIPVGTVLYLKPSSSQWASANARYALYLFKDGGSSTWVDAEEVCNNDGYYQAIVPEGVFEELIWCRMNPNTTENNWDNKWNQTGDLTYNSSYDLFTVSTTNDWNGATTTWSKWTTKQPCCNAVAKPTITLVSSPVKCREDVTAGSITIDGYDDSKYTYTLYKDGDATTIAYGDDGYAITEAGSYTVTADVSENSCGVQTSEPQVVTVTDNTHTINDFIVTPASDNVCKGSSVTLTATDVNGASYAWYKGTSETPISGATSYTYSPTITENTTFKVVVTKTNNGCPATADATSAIQVIELPEAPALNTNSTTVCSGVEFILPGDYNWYEVSTGGTKLNSATISGGITSNKSYWAEAKNASGCVSTSRTEYTVNVDAKPKVVLTTNEEESICQGDEINLEGYIEEHSGTIKWYSDSEYNTEITELTFTPNTQTYYVKATNGVCEPATASLSIKVIAKPTIPTFDTVDPRCDSYTLPTNDKGGLPIKWYETMESVTPLSDNTTVTASGTYYAEGVNGNCVSDSRTELEVTINATPTITASAAVTQPNVALTLNSAAGDDTEWEVYTNPNEAGSITNSKGASVNFIATEIGEYVVKATNGDCSFNFTITVADAFYVYMRQPKKGETAYNNFYYPTQNPTQGGDLFYKEYASIPPAEGYTDYNKGGVAHDIIFTDCDGYVWYGFKASDKLIDGTNYFTVHAPNKNGYDGWFTHTDITKPGKMTGDIYYIMGTEGNGNSGWKIEEASAPYSGPVVHASGNDFSFNKNNFADFVALYVTDCSGKEIDYYQWQYSQTENGKYDDYSSVCTYVGKKSEQGDAGKTNNIRPNVAGWYRCTATYKDGSSLTSAAKQVTATSGTSYSFTSDLPIIMVNTNGYGFPSCDGLSGTASKNADVLKAKISVDVKIYEDETLVYDRKARMNYRGSSSLNFVKKSYAFCPGKADCVEDKGRVDYVKTEKLNMLGVGSAVDKDWVLYAAAADPSIMRNRLMFDTFRDMTGTWSVQSRYVELIVDGEYKGIYVFMDKITNNANRVNITDEDGFIVKFDKTDLVDRYEGSGDKKTFKSLYSGKDGSGTYDTQIDQRFEIEYPEMEDVEEEEAGKWAKTVNKIKSMFNNFETQLKAGNYAEVQKIIDYNSWADWFIITEFAKNMDAYRASNLFVYNGDKIEARPLWDQELSFKNYCATLCDDYSCDNAEGLLIRTSKIYDEGESCSAPFWFTGKYVSGRGTEAIGGSQQFVGYLLNDPCFVQTVKDRWNEHKNKALSAESLNAKLERYTNEMATALDREKSIWKSEGGKLSRETCQCSYNGTTGYSDIKISDSKDDITEWINARPSELEEALNDEVGTGLSISFSDDNIDTTPWEPVILQVHNESGYDYVLTYTDNALDQLTGVIIEKNGDTYKYNIPRPANWGTGDEATEGERANIVYGLKATLQMDSSNVVCGSQAEVPFDEATITLQDEPNEDCVQP